MSPRKPKFKYCALNGYEQCGERFDCCVHCAMLPVCNKACPTAKSGRPCEYAIAAKSSSRWREEADPCTEEINYPSYLAREIIVMAVFDLVRARRGKQMLSEHGARGTPPAVVIEVHAFLQSDYYKHLAEAAWPDSPPDGEKMYEWIMHQDPLYLSTLIKRIGKETELEALRD